MEVDYIDLGISTHFVLLSSREGKSEYAKRTLELKWR